MDQLREAMSTLAVPEALEPWRVQPWKGVDGWESLERRDGREALIWEGPRGIDIEADATVRETGRVDVFTLTVTVRE
jgi:hypothetical protein